MGPRRRLLVGLYTASGAAALVYEVTWTRLFSLQLGHTVAAASTVLAAFMGGLALGAWAAGRLLARGAFAIGSSGSEATPPPRTLTAYASLEILVAIVALALPLALRATTPLLAWAYADGTAPARFAIVRVAISLMLLGIPAAAMGATFPLAAEWYADASLLYAVNSAGAAAGALAGGFWLVPAVGLRGTTWVGVALNVIAAAGAFAIAAPHQGTTASADDVQTVGSRAIAAGSSAKASRATRTRARSAKASRHTGSEAARTSSRATTDRPSPRIAVAVAAVSGFAALVYEVAWTRLLALVIGPTTYAFATMATAFIGGLAIGSLIGARVARRVQRPVTALTLTLIGGALAAVVTAWYTATRMPLAIAAEVADPSIVFSRVVAWQAGAVVLVLLPMTLALGATFPLALAAARDVREGLNAARVYTANTAGAIVGALVAGFVLVPYLGLRATFEWTATFAIVASAVCLAVSATTETPDRRRRGVRGMLPSVAAALVAVAIVFALPPWDRELLASGAYKYAPYLKAGEFDTLLRAGRLEFYKEGAASTVSVRRLTGTLSLAIDGKVDASNGGDMLTQRMLGLLPVLIHGHAGEICVIGLGSGVTVDSAFAAGTVRRADVVEISPEVVDASRVFETENGRVLSKPGVRLIVGDGRSHLLLTPRTYDVIVSEPSNPWMAGVASLFTREFFAAARARLKPDGVLCQWAHTYDISAADLQSIVRTFASVFPDGTMWLVGDADLLLIGAKDGPIMPRVDGLARDWRRGTASAALTGLGIADRAAAFDLVSMFAGGPRQLATFGDSARVQTDDHTVLEYSAPRAIYGRTLDDNAAAIRALAPALPDGIRAAVDGASADSWTSRGRMLLKTEAYALAFDALRRAVTLDSRNADALAALSDAAAGARKQDEERTLLKNIAAREPTNAAVRVELSRVLAASGDFDRALATAREAVSLAPDDAHTAEQLASVLADAGDADRLAPLADALVARFPSSADARYYRASALFLRGRTEDALAEARHVVETAPSHARAQNLLGAACATLGRRDCAEAAFQASIRANPRDAGTYVNLGLFYLQTGNRQQAAEIFAEALALAPDSDAARNGLGQARAELAR